MSHFGGSRWNRASLRPVTAAQTVLPIILTPSIQDIMVCAMRTTLTLDEDVAAKLRQLAQRRKTSFKQIVNEVLRRGLSTPQTSSRRRRPFKAKTFSSPFRPGVDPLKLGQLSDDLEAQ
jgi:hypothetical protein